MVGGGLKMMCEPGGPGILEVRVEVALAMAVARFRRRLVVWNRHCIRKGGIAVIMDWVNCQRCCIEDQKSSRMRSWHFAITCTRIFQPYEGLPEGSIYTLTAELTIEYVLIFNLKLRIFQFRSPTPIIEKLVHKLRVSGRSYRLKLLAS